MRHPCRYYETCPIHCKNGRPLAPLTPKKVKSKKPKPKKQKPPKSCFIPQSVIMPCYACTRYDTELKLIGEKDRFRKFVDVTGKEHQCVKFRDGNWVKCSKLVLL